MNHAPSCTQHGHGGIRCIHAGPTQNPPAKTRGRLHVPHRAAHGFRAGDDGAKRNHHDGNAPHQPVRRCARAGRGTAIGGACVAGRRGGNRGGNQRTPCGIRATARCCSAHHPPVGKTLAAMGHAAMARRWGSHRVSGAVATHHHAHIVGEQPNRQMPIVGTHRGESRTRVAGNLTAGRRGVVARQRLRVRSHHVGGRVAGGGQ